MKYTVYVDGQEGTTGLEILDYLAERKDIELIRIESDKRKDTAARAACLNAADIAILCLPDDAAREAVSLVANPSTRILDASTAHRTRDDWAYGIPELSGGHRAKIQTSYRVAVPGCYATGFIMAVYPLIAAKVLPSDARLTCHGISGYSGAGKKMIAQFDVKDHPAALDTPRMYAFGLQHKHLPEMQKVCGLQHVPLLTPVVANYYRGMVVSIPLSRTQLVGQPDADALRQVLQAHYQGQPFVKVMPSDTAVWMPDGFLDPLACNHTNRIELAVFGREDQLLVVARLDNLGKGACGAAVQNLNLMLGIPEETGLRC